MNDEWSTGMKNVMFAMVAFLAVGCAQAEMVRIMANEHGATVAVEPFELWGKVKEVLNAKETVYVEYFEERNQAGLLYADAAEGIQDAPTKVAKEITVPVSIPTALGKSIDEHPWGWTLGAAGLAVGTYLIGDQAGWWGKSSDDGADRPQIAVQSGNQSPVTIIIGEGNNPGSGTKVDSSESVTNP